MAEFHGVTEDAFSRIIPRMHDQKVHTIFFIAEELEPVTDAMSHFIQQSKSRPDNKQDLPQFQMTPHCPSVCNAPLKKIDR